MCRLRVVGPSPALMRGGALVGAHSRDVYRLALLCACSARGVCGGMETSAALYRRVSAGVGNRLARVAKFVLYEIVRYSAPRVQTYRNGPKVSVGVRRQIQAGSPAACFVVPRTFLLPHSSVPRRGARLGLRCAFAFARAARVLQASLPSPCLTVCVVCLCLHCCCRNCCSLEDNCLSTAYDLDVIEPWLHVVDR